MRGGRVYMMTDRYRGAIYIGVTSHIEGRSFQHHSRAGSDIRRRYLTRLVYTDWTEQVSESDEALTARVEDAGSRPSRGLTDVWFDGA